MRAWAGSSGTAGYFDGNVFITGNLNVTGSLTGYTETDPVFSVWDKSAGISIIESQISDLSHFTTADETDPAFGSSVVSGITGQQIDSWDSAYSNYDRTNDSWIGTGTVYTTADRVGIGTATPTALLTVAGTIESTSGGIIFPDGTVQLTASSSGDGHSLDSADASQVDVVFVDNSGNVGVGTQTPSDRLDVIGKLKVTPGTYAYEQGYVVIDYQTPRCACDSTVDFIDCDVTFYTMSDEGTTCYDWYQEGSPPITPIIDYSSAYDRMSNPRPVMEMNASNDLIVTSFKVQPAKYLYTQGFSTFSGHLTPQCPCDTAIEESTAECGNFAGNFYTNIDRGPLCYDWHLSGGVAESYGFSRSFPVSLSAEIDITSGIPAITINDFTRFNGDVLIGGISLNGGKLAVRNGVQDPNNYGIHATSIFGTGGYFSTNFGYGLVVENGNVGIGTTTPAYKLDVNGDLHVNGAILQRAVTLHADYVFEPDYNLESINEHADFMWKNKHLKAIPKASVDKSGMEFVDVGSHRRGIVEELEKAHIYIEKLHDQVNIQSKHISTLDERIAEIEAFMKKNK